MSELGKRGLGKPPAPKPDKKPGLADRLKVSGDGGEQEQSKLAGDVSSLLKRAETAKTATDALPEEEVTALNNKIAAINKTYGDLVKRVRLADIMREVAQLGEKSGALSGKIAQVRSQGYIFRAYLEQKAEVLAADWKEIDGDIKAWVETESEPLRQSLADAEQVLKKLDAQTRATKTKEELAGQLEGVLERLGQQVKAAEDYVKGLYEALKREITQTDRQIEEIHNFLKHLAESGLSLASGESIYMVTSAEWDDGRDKPNGLLFMTDQRLIFEQKEKVGKKLGLFGGKAVQDVLWEVPLHSIEEVKAEKKGMLGGKDMVNLRLGSGAPYPAITVEVKGGADCRLWAQEINRARKGDINGDRSVEPDPELIEKLRKAPTECPSCGGMLPVIMAGQTQMECKYCGAVIRL